MKAAAPAVLLALLSAAALVPGAGAANVEPARFEFGALERGDAREEHVLVTNPSTEEVQVVLVPGGDAWDTFLDVSPASFALGPAGTRDVAVALTIPDDAAPGRHDLDIQVVEQAGGGSGGTGQGSIDVRIVFEVLAADLTYLERREDGLLAIVDNWLGSPVTARVEGDWLDGEGASLGAFEGDPVAVASKAREYVELPLEMPDGAESLRARAVIDGVAGAWRTLALDHGAQPALESLDADATRRGATLSAHVTNPLASTSAVRVEFELMRSGAVVERHTSDLTDVPALGSREVSWAWRGDPGTYTARARLLVDEAQGPWVGTAEPFTVTKKASDGGIPGFEAAALLGAVAAGLALASRRRGGAR